MAKEIALKLKITSQGEEKVISNISELETELQKLQTTLKTLDFGSAAFKEATANISKLRTKIDEIDKASEGIGAEKKFRAFGDAINILTGSFQVASGALGLFISDEKSLEQVQQAETAALNVLNVALGINAINTALVESATLRKTIADKASAIATRAAAIAQAAYNAVLNANPIVLFITAITALTGAIYLLVKATDEDTDAQGKSNLEKKKAIELDNELSSVQKKAAIDLKVQTTILTDNVATRNLELQTIEDLKKTYPGFNAFVDKNNNLTKDGIRFLGIQIALQEKQAILQALRTKKVDLEIKANQDLSDEIANQGTIIGKTTTKITQFFKGNFTDISAFGGALQDAVRDEAAGLNVVNDEIADQTKEVDKLLGQLKPLNKALKDTADAEAAAAKETKTATEVIDKNLLLINNRIKALDGLNEALKKSQQAEVKYTSEIVQRQEEVLDQQEAFLKERGEKFKTAGEKLVDEINNYLFKTIPSEVEAQKLLDGYEKLFTTIDEGIKSGQLDFKKATGWDKFVEFAETKLPGIGKKLVNVNEESKTAFIEYFNSLDERIVKISKSSGDLLKDLFPTEATLEGLNALRDTEEAITKLRLDKNKSGFTALQIEEKSIKIIEKRFGIETKLNEINRKIAEEQYNIATTRDEKQKKKSQDRIDALNNEIKSYKALGLEILNGALRTDTFVQGLRSVGDEAEKNVKKITDLKTQIDAVFDPNKLEGLKTFFKDNAGEFLTTFTEILNNEEGYFNKLGEDGIKALFSGIDEGLSNVEGKTREELESIQKYLKIFGDEFGKDFGLEDNPFIKALDKISKKLKELPTESKEAFNKTLTDIKDVADKVLSAFNQISTQFSSVVQQQNSLLLEQLQYQQDTALKLIGEANTENEAENKRIAAERLAVEKDFQKKKFDIEKKARIQELQFQLANALAATAQGIITALATPPLGVGIALAAILAGLAGAQVAVIKDQIDFTQNKAYLGRTGGLVEGSSHDSYGGGVPTMLEGGEFILNKEAVRAYGDTISSINTATGGKPMSIDDSRIVQAISKQNLSTKQPLKAYVLYNDIQDTTKLNNKIEQLARL